MNNILGKISWRDPNELNRNLVIQILESQTVKTIDPNIITPFMEIILKCFNLEAGYQSFDEILQELKPIYSKYIGTDIELYDPYAEDLNKERLFLIEKLNTTAVSDFLKPSHKSYQRINILSQEARRITSNEDFPRSDLDWERLVIKIEYNRTISEWLSGKGHDYKVDIYY